MRHRPQIILLAATIALGAVSAPFTGRVAAADRWITVRPGDTLSGIAARHGVTVQRLVRLNDLADANRVYAGQRLRLRAPDGRSDERADRPASRSATRHLVVYGDTLSGIALVHGVTVTAIARANDIANVSFIRAGQVLRIPGERGDQPRSRQGRAERPRTYTTHRVAYGETLWGIAARYGSSVSAIAEANRITDPSFIRAGQELRIPGARVRDGARRWTDRGRGAGSLGGPTAAMPGDMAVVVAARREIGRIIVAEARRQGVPPAFALAVAWQESGWQPRVVSYAGAIGVMQLLPSTGDWVSATMLGRPVNLWEPQENVLAGVRLLKHYLVRYGGDRSLVLAAYYQGMSAADRYGIFPVSRPYIASILRLQQLFAG
jgi:LysM repeat protein